ncbi:MAG: ribosome maturation factor RimM [candidate division Zixibacteria bacterium]|nr:ribosome maturation factor RimM [candidate division Zixibacteria bacterium]
MSDEEFVVVGRLGRPRGLNGEIYVTPETDFPDRFVGLKDILVRRRGDWEKIKIVSAAIVSGRPVLRFEGIRTPEDAARFTNCDVAVPKTEMVELPEGSHYIFELVGCELIEEKTGRLLGRVVDVEQYPANDAYVIETTKGKKVLFPAVKKFVREIDTEAGRITVDPAGLIENEKSQTAVDEV